MNTAAFYQNFINQLQTIYNKQEATIIAEWVWESKVGIKKFDFIRNPAIEIDSAQKDVLENNLIELLQHKPVQYVTGEAWFYKMKLSVNKNVLIPRPETEELVQWVVDDFQKRGKEKAIILDIGTGSGCIAIALKKLLPDVMINAVDKSKDALQVAEGNAILQNVKINFSVVDFLNEINWQAFPIFDCIVSNPPYIPVSEKEKLNKNVAAYEPATALFVPNNHPLIFYEAIAFFAKKHLKKEGKIFVETHEDYSIITAKMFEKHFKKVEMKQDVFGKNRMIMATQCH